MFLSFLAWPLISSWAVLYYHFPRHCGTKECWFLLGQCRLTQANTFASRGGEKALPLQSCSAVFPDLSKLYNFLHVPNSRRKNGLRRTRLHQGQWGQHNSPEQLTTASRSDPLCPGPVPHPCIPLTHPQNLQNPAWAEEGAPAFTPHVYSFAGDQCWFEPALTLPSSLQRNKETG